MARPIININLQPYERKELEKRVKSRVIRDGSFTSVKELISSINTYIDNRENKPYIWKADGIKILEKINRAKFALSRSC